jgi:hypothetical protein
MRPERYNCRIVPCSVPAVCSCLEQSASSRNLSGSWIGDLPTLRAQTLSLSNERKLQEAPVLPPGLLQVGLPFLDAAGSQETRLPGLSRSRVPLSAWLISGAS